MDILPTVFDDMSHFGPLARTVEDAALFLRLAEGPAAADISSQRVPVPLPERPCTSPGTLPRAPAWSTSTRRPSRIGTVSSESRSRCSSTRPWRSW